MTTKDKDASLPERTGDFDFLVGQWDLSIVMGGDTENQLAGRWQAKHLHGGRILIDDVVVLGPGGETLRSMATIRTYVPSSDQWVCSFLYAQELPDPVELVGGLVGEEIHLEARLLRTGEQAAVRFFDIASDSFAWEQRNVSGEVELLITARRSH